MDPIDRLMAEHRVIEKAIAILEKIVGEYESRGEIDTGDVESLIDFIRTFADKCHHGKEEGVLFPKMIERGIPKEGGPIGVMLDEHEQGRDAVRRMSKGISMIKGGESGGRDLFIKAAWDYITLLRGHIDKEDNILFPMAREVMTPSDIDEMVNEFDRVEREDIGEGVHEKYEALIHRLSGKYLGDVSHHHIH